MLNPSTNSNGFNGVEENLSLKRLTRLPGSVMNMVGLTSLTLSSNLFAVFPDEVALMASLRRLDLSWNQITCIPASISGCTKLEVLIMSFNQLTSVSPRLGELSCLRDLRLNDNKLRAIPDSFSGLVALQEFNLQYNEIDTIPLSVIQLPKLRTLSVSGNPLSSPPASVAVAGLYSMRRWLEEKERAPSQRRTRHTDRRTPPQQADARIEEHVPASVSLPDLSSRLLLRPQTGMQQSVGAFSRQYDRPIPPPPGASGRPRTATGAILGEALRTHALATSAFASRESDRRGFAGVQRNAAASVNHRAFPGSVGDLSSSSATSDLGVNGWSEAEFEASLHRHEQLVEERARQFLHRQISPTTRTSDGHTSRNSSNSSTVSSALRPRRRHGDGSSSTRTTRASKPHGNTSLSRASRARHSVTSSGNNLRSMLNRSASAVSNTVLSQLSVGGSGVTGRTTETKSNPTTAASRSDSRRRRNTSRSRQPARQSAQPERLNEPDHQYFGPWDWRNARRVLENASSESLSTEEQQTIRQAINPELRQAPPRVIDDLAQLQNMLSGMGRSHLALSIAEVLVDSDGQHEDGGEPAGDVWDDFDESHPFNVLPEPPQVRQTAPVAKSPHVSDGGSSTPAPRHFLCPITYEIMQTPVVASDGHTYEKTAISTWFSTHHTSPMTGQRLNSKVLTPNFALKSMIQEWKTQDSVASSS